MIWCRVKLHLMVWEDIELNTIFTILNTILYSVLATAASSSVAMRPSLAAEGWREGGCMPAVVFVFDWEGERQQRGRGGGTIVFLASTSQLSPRDQFLGHSSLKASRSQSVCVLSTLCSTTHYTTTHTCTKLNK